jgi:hypothetical protein
VDISFNRTVMQKSDNAVLFPHLCLQNADLLNVQTSVILPCLSFLSVFLRGY